MEATVPGPNGIGAEGQSRFEERSPRIQHFDGDIPPTLSPLDAFAAHSRRLAQELEETRKAGERRMSRLPPAIVTKSLTQLQANRPQCFRNLSGHPDIVPPLPSPTNFLPGSNLLITNPVTRQLSQHPQVNGLHKHPIGYEEHKNIPALDTKHDFELPRTDSPIQIPLGDEHQRLNRGLVYRRHHKQGSSGSQPDVSSMLAPPNAAFIRKAYHESSDDDFAGSNAGSVFSQSRKLSSCSGTSQPPSPYISDHNRSSSTNSVNSALSQKRSHLNFSRPRSNTSLSSIAHPLSPTRESTGSGAPAGSLRSDASFDDVRFERQEGTLPAKGSAYTHSKFALPRGRLTERTSSVFHGLSTPHFEWQEPMFNGTPQLKQDVSVRVEQPPDAARLTPEQDTIERILSQGFLFDFSAEPKPLPGRGRSTSHVVTNPGVTPEDTRRPSTAHARPTPDVVPAMPAFGSDVASITGNTRSSRSNSTIRPGVTRAGSDYQALSADEHVDKGIEAHQKGDLKQSTYHLRIAAKQDDPTGMLLYALACRHGWGVRPNKAEAVQYLRKAVDLAMREVAVDENPGSTERQADAIEKKAHRAQFALGIYELGVSHMNGWGVEQDKALALRCFEIAGQWGDVDALTEAGFCHAEGIGCKKDMKKAAKFYRMAEARGVSMVGNSWIYKDKYNDAGNERSRSSQKTSAEPKRSKSKTRSIFGRRKAQA